MIFSTIINLEQRLTYLSRAVLCAKAAVDASADQAELLHDLEDKLEVRKFFSKLFSDPFR